MNIKNLITASFLLILAGCGSGQKKAEQFTALPFPDVIPPAMMSDEKERAEYLVLHWWDRIADPSREYPCDTTFVSGVKKGDVEQKFANWTNFLGMIEFSAASRSVNRLYDRAYACEKADTSSNVFETLSHLVYKYLFDPNSPLRNEDFYAVYASRMAKSDLVEPVMQSKYAKEAELSSLNRVGTKAADFRFSDSRGRMYNLYDIDAPLTLIFFSNPGCTACKEIMDVLNNDQIISGLIADGTMKVLNIYIDEDIQAWRSYMPIYPKTWYNGFDPDLTIREVPLYNVRAIPSLYLLDKNKTVIMKDAPEPRVFEWLSRYQNL